MKEQVKEILEKEGVFANYNVPKIADLSRDLLADKLLALLSPKGEKENRLPNEQLAYIAGLVDGEGYIGIQKWLFDDRKTFDYIVRFELAMTDKAPIDYVNKLLPKPKAIACVTRGRQLPYYRLTLSHGSAIHFLREIAPFLRSRVAQKVALCIQLEELKKQYSPNKSPRGFSKFRSFSSEYIEKAERIYQQLSLLQKKKRVKPKMEVSNE